MAAAALAQDDHQIGRRGHDAAEVCRLAARGRDQREREQQGDQEADRSQRHLHDDQVSEVRVGAGPDRLRAGSGRRGRERGQGVAGG